MTDTDRMTEAYELGCSRGWDHAGFVDAYGKEHERSRPDYPAWMLTDSRALGDEYNRFDLRYSEVQQRREWQMEFKRGWTDGRRRFHRGRYPDGTKIDD